MWRDAAAKQGCRFGVSEHLGSATSGFREPSFRQDRSAGRRSLWTASIAVADCIMTPIARACRQQKWRGMGMYSQSRGAANLDRMTDLINKYQPDCFTPEGLLPFEEYGMRWWRICTT